MDPIMYFTTRLTTQQKSICHLSTYICYELYLSHFFIKMIWLSSCNTTARQLSWTEPWITLEKLTWTLSIWSQCLVRLPWIPSESKIADIPLLGKPTLWWSLPFVLFPYCCQETVVPQTPGPIYPSATKVRASSPILIKNTLLGGGWNWNTCRAD